MAFNSLQYAAFLPAVLLVVWAVRSHRAQNGFLVLASYLFYAAWDWRFLGLLLISTLVDHRVGLELSRTDEADRRRQLLLVSLAVNLGILGTFKYLGFFVESMRDLLGGLGLGVEGPFLDLVLPVGISFYTFQTIAYVVDVYRGRVEPEPDLVTFALYVAFFPQLVAGPIERAQNLLPRLRQHRPRPSPADLASGGGLILFGLWKKVAVADALAPVVQNAWTNPGSAGWGLLMLGTYAFALQIYCDFSGYTDIARGSGRLLGVELMRNFREPYLSRSLTEFWRTWHISLSTWLRDYLYVPLGGNRRSRRRTYLNLLVVMALGGLWHGAAWTFVVWGILHGVWLAAERFWRDVRRGTGDGKGWPTLQWVATFHGVMALWVLFRAPSLRDGLQYLRDLVMLQSGRMASLDEVLLVAVLGSAVVIADLARRRGLAVRWARPRPRLAGATVGLAMLMVVVWSGGTATPFIYFQF